MVLKLSDGQAANLLNDYSAGGVTQADLAAKYGVSQTLVSLIVRGKLHAAPRVGNNQLVKGRVTEAGRECSQCRVFKEWGEYSVNPRAKLTGHFSACKACRNKINRESACDKRRARVRELYLKRKYGLTLAEYAQLEQEQGGKCALCLQPEQRRERKAKNGVIRIVEFLGVDHDHSCGEHGPERACKHCIRGLLCDDCNRLVGFAEAKPTVAARFSDYLTQRPFLSEGGWA